MTVGSDMVDVNGICVKVAVETVRRETAPRKTALYNVLPDAIILGHE